MSVARQPGGQPNRPGGNLKWDLTMQCTSHSYNTELSYGVYIEILSQFACQEDTSSCRADPKVASPVPAQFSLDSHFGHPERQDDTATFQCLLFAALWVLAV